MSNQQVTDFVVLVDANDNQIGTCEKLEAHQKNLLHRAFSVILFNDQGELLLQKRAANKYHSPLLWTNSCCSHPAPNENLEAAVTRRLQEELYVVADAKHLFYFIYQADFDNGLSEYELDHVFIAQYNQTPEINPEEAAAYKWLPLSEVKKQINLNPEQFTVWFKLIIENHSEELEKAIHESL